MPGSSDLINIGQLEEEAQIKPGRGVIPKLVYFPRPGRPTMLVASGRMKPLFPFCMSTLGLFKKHGLAAPNKTHGIPSNQMLTGH